MDVPTILPSDGQSTTKKNNGLIMFLLFFIIILGAGYSVFLNSQPKNQLQSSLPISPQTPSQETSLAIPPEWKTYSSSKNGFALSYPNTMVANEQSNGSVELQLFGTSQTLHEDFYDGIKLTVKKNSLSGKQLKDVVDEEVQKEQKSYGEVSQPQGIMVNNRSGFTFTAKSNNDTTFVFLPAETDTYIMVQYSIKDPNQKGYQQTVNQIISSLRMFYPQAINQNQYQASQNSTESASTVAMTAFHIDQLNLDISVPQKLTATGQFKTKYVTVPTGYSGTQVCAAVLLSVQDDPCNTVIFGLGALSSNYNLIRGATYTDIQGFEKTEGKYYAKIGGRPIELPTNLVKEFTNPNGIQIIKVIGLNTHDGYAVNGTPGEGWISAIVNTQDKTFPGFTILMKLLPNLTEADLDAVLSSLKFTK